MAVAAARNHAPNGRTPEPEHGGGVGRLQLWPRERKLTTTTLFFLDSHSKLSSEGTHFVRGTGSWAPLCCFFC